MDKVMKLLRFLGKGLNYLLIAILVMLGLPLFFSIVYGNLDSEELFAFMVWLVFYIIVRVVGFVFNKFIPKKLKSMSIISKGKLATKEFINGIVDEIIRTDSKVDISEATYISLNDVKKLKEYVPIFRLHLLLIMLTKTSKDVFEISKRYSLLMDAIETTCIKYGLTEEESKEYSKRVHDMQENYENKIGYETVHKEDVYFHACKYFTELLFPDESAASDKRLGTLNIAKDLWKQLDNIYSKVTLSDCA